MKPSAAKRSFEMELEIAAPTTDVWDAIATAEGICNWFAPEAELTPGEGGEITWSWNEFFHWSQTVETWKPGERLRTRYDSAVDDGAGGKVPLFIEFTLEGRGESRTLLRLVHSGFGPEASFDEEYDGISHGWSVELRSLQLYLEHHAGRKRRLTWSSAPVSMGARDAWARLSGPEGLGFAARLEGAQPGAAFSLTTRAAGELVGVLLSASDHELSAKLTSHGDAFLRMSADNCGGSTHVWLWLATYDALPNTDLDGVKAEWDATLDRLFPERVEPGAVQPERATVSKES